jgi:hypothetical protein
VPTKKAKPSHRAPMPGVIQANIQLPVALHEQMKALRQARQHMELTDVRLCRIYREAVEQYVNSKPQQQLLNGGRKALRPTG